MIVSSIDRFRTYYTWYHAGLFAAFLLCASLTALGFLRLGVTRRDAILSMRASDIRADLHQDFRYLASAVASLSWECTEAGWVAGLSGPDPAATDRNRVPPPATVNPASTAIDTAIKTAIASYGIGGIWVFDNYGRLMRDTGTDPCPTSVRLAGFYDPTRTVSEGVTVFAVGDRLLLAAVSPVRGQQRLVGHLVGYRPLSDLYGRLAIRSTAPQLDIPIVSLYCEHRPVQISSLPSDWVPELGHLGRAFFGPVEGFAPGRLPLRRTLLTPVSPGQMSGLVLALEDRRVFLQPDNLLLIPAFVPFLLLLLVGIRWGRAVIDEQLIGPLQNLRDTVNRISLDAPHISIPDDPPEEIRLLYKTLRFFAQRSAHHLAEARKKMHDIQMLNDVGHTLQGLASIDKTFDTVLEAVLTMAHFDRVIVARVDSQAQRLSGKVAFRTPSTVLAPESRASYPIAIPMSMQKGGTAAKVVLTRSPYHSFNDPNHPSNLSGELMLPLVVHGEVVGVFGVDNFQSKRPIFKEDLPILEAIASQVGLAIRNATLMEELVASIRSLEEVNRRLETTSSELAVRNTELTQRKAALEREIRVATEIQQVLLPTDIPLPPTLDAAAVVHPARELGGDFYHFVRLDEHRLAVAIGDVSGKGVPAALVMSLAHSLLMTQIPLETDLTRIFDRVNHHLLASLEELESYYLTCLLAVIDTERHQLRLVKAGHLNPYYQNRPAERGEWLQAEGTFLGMFDDLGLEERIVPFPPGARLVLYTDGVTECMDAADRRWGEEAFGRFLDRHAACSSAEVLRRLSKELAAHRQQAPLSDDITALVIDHTLPQEETMVLDGSIDQVSPALRWLESRCERTGFQPRPDQDLTAVVRELLFNASEHGCQGRADRQVRLGIRLLGNRCEVTVADPGPGFDPTPHLADLDGPLTADTRLGLRLARWQSRSLQFSDNGRTVTATFDHPLRASARGAPH